MHLRTSARSLSMLRAMPFWATRELLGSRIQVMKLQRRDAPVVAT